MKTLLRRKLTGRNQGGFTLVEMLVASTITVMLSGIMFAILSQTSRVVGRTVGKVEEFREARNAFEAVTTRLAQATLNTYIDYDNATTPTKYLRRSELRFITGPAAQVLTGASPAGKVRSTDAIFFEAPVGLTAQLPKYASFENLLCTCGYYLEVATDQTIRPKFLTENIVPLRFRPRLMEFAQPTEQNGLYAKTNGITSRTYNGKEWYTTFVSPSNAPVHPIAENIVAFIVTPRLAPADEAEVKGTTAASDPDGSPLAPRYLYDSAPQSPPPDTRYKDGRLNPTNQLPPMLQVTLVAVDEPGAIKLGYDSTNLDPLALSTKFVNTTDFSKDLLRTGADDSVENKLIAQRVNYRIFTTNVIIRGAKWSREQTQTN